MLIEALYHPPHIEVDARRTEKGPLVLVHRFEGKPLVAEYIANTMLGIEYLWGRPVVLETTERGPAAPAPEPRMPVGVHTVAEETEPSAAPWQRVRYTMKNRQLSREIVAD
jgi:stage V sporulation protein R